MEMLTNLLIDSFNGFSPRLIPLFVLQLLVSGMLALMIQVIVRKMFKESNNNLIVIAVAVTLIVSIGKLSLPYSIIAGAVIILLGLRLNSESKTNIYTTFFVILLAVGCGIGSIVQTAIGALIIGALILFIPLKNEA